MPKRKLTAASVEKLAPPKKGRTEYFDIVLPGFALRVTDKGSKSWVYFYRIHGRQRRMTIGSYPAFDLAQAREEARAAQREVEKGNDPAGTRVEARRQKPDTVREVVEKYAERHLRPNNKTAGEVERMFARHVLPAWRERPMHDITRRDIIELIDGVADRTSPTRANRVLANVRRLFSWAVERDIINATPVAGVRPPGKERSRERVLSDDEIRAFWSACDETGWPFGPFFQMLIVTAQRRNEVSHMRWSDIDEDSGVWSLPREWTKADRGHEVPLSPLALRILESIPNVGSFVFMSGRVEDRPISGFGKAKARLDEISGLSGWRLHDLRRTAGTNMARLGIPISIISRVLNHAEGGVTKIYARASYLEQKRDALGTWAGRLETIIGEREENVVSLPVGGR